MNWGLFALGIVHKTRLFGKYFGGVKTNKTGLRHTQSKSGDNEREFNDSVKSMNYKIKVHKRRLVRQESGFAEENKCEDSFI
jgi:hypothetical protein